MKHILCHKDIEVLEFETDDGWITEVGKVFDESHVPMSVLPNERGQTLRRNLQDWWRGRAIPG